MIIAYDVRSSSHVSSSSDFWLCLCSPILLLLLLLSLLLLPHGRAANLPVFSFFGARPLLLYASLFFPLFLSHTKIFVGRPPPREKGGGKKDEGNLCDLFFSKVCARAWVRGKHSKFDCFENERGWKQKSNSKICSSLAVGTIRTVRTLSKIHI